jgi:hypothetical protein
LLCEVNVTFELHLPNIPWNPDQMDFDRYSLKIPDWTFITLFTSLYCFRHFSRLSQFSSIPSLLTNPANAIERGELDRILFVIRMILLNTERNFTSNAFGHSWVTKWEAESSLELSNLLKNRWNQQWKPDNLWREQLLSHITGWIWTDFSRHKNYRVSHPMYSISESLE